MYVTHSEPGVQVQTGIQGLVVLRTWEVWGFPSLFHELICIQVRGSYELEQEGNSGGEGKWYYRKEIMPNLQLKAYRVRPWKPRLKDCFVLHFMRPET